MHWWAVVATIVGRRDSVPLDATYAGGHRLLFRFEGVVPSRRSVELLVTARQGGLEPHRWSVAP